MTRPSMKAVAQRIKRDGLTLWFALRDPRTPWWVQVLAALVVAYALSPIDLVPDFIPVLGYLDDVILLPGLIWLAVRCMPAVVLHDCRKQADAWLAEHRRKPVSPWGVLLVAGIWGLVGWGLWRWWT